MLLYGTRDEDGDDVYLFEGGKSNNASQKYTKNEDDGVSEREMEKRERAASKCWCCAT